MLAIVLVASFSCGVREGRVCHLRTEVGSPACGRGLRRAVFLSGESFYATCKQNSSLIYANITSHWKSWVK